MFKYLSILFIALCIQTQIFAHSGRAKYHVVIDTDGAIDDLRAITMLLASNDVQVLAITCSQGTLAPSSCYYKVNSLITDLYHEGIPIGLGSEMDYPLPEWNSFSEKIYWGSSMPVSKLQPKAIDVIHKAIKDYPNKITFIALGSLNTYAGLFRKYPEYAERAEQIIWYNESNIKERFNYLIDTVSYHYIKESDVSLNIVSNNRTDLRCNDEYLKYIKNTNSTYAQQIYKVLSQPLFAERMKQEQWILWDDLLPLYLNASILFSTERKGNISRTVPEASIPADFIYENISGLLASANITNNQVFISFPTDSSLYKNNYKEMLPSTLKKYGEIEWKAITMTNEIHGHTGIYSIIGAKMGIRACEYFNTGLNNLKVTSFVGSTPPYSCLNDGLQISTGATIGQGLITISDTVLQIPTVLFEFNHRKIKISIQAEMARKMQADIEYGVKKYGMSDAYWNYIENLAIHYWADFDRHIIFEIEKL